MRVHARFNSLELLDGRVGRAAAKTAARYLFHVGFVNRDTRGPAARVR